MPDLTHEKRALAPRHVLYEIEMFHHCLKSPEIDIKDAVVQRLYSNARLESLLIHARILLDFFETEAADRKKDDVISEDMDFAARRIETREPSNGKAPIPGLESLRDRIHKRLAHLTYSRQLFWNDERSSWPVGCFLPIEDRCKEILESPASNAFVVAHADEDTKKRWAVMREAFGASKNNEAALDDGRGDGSTTVEV